MFFVYKKVCERIVTNVTEMLQTPDPHKSDLNVTDLLQMLQKCYGRGGWLRDPVYKKQKNTPPVPKKFHEVKIGNKVFRSKKSNP